MNEWDSMLMESINHIPTKKRNETKRNEIHTPHTNHMNHTLDRDDTCKGTQNAEGII